MDKAARVRWTVLLAALTATLVAVFYPIDEEALPIAAPPSSQREDSLPAPVIPGDIAEEGESPDTDPFSPRGWQAPPPPAVASVSVVPAALAPTTPESPPGAPPLPFRFVGSLKDGADLLVYLARGDETIVARPGEVLEGTYKVTGVSASQMDFEHIPTGQKQALVFPVRDN
ncbi:hypothetical protein [Duganella sp. BuS-21]|uniref:hypothetical protein n=1 Tax=Duganella sp. BuS-21 TaxID=2943848 RepID=UPI0035A61604